MDLRSTLIQCDPILTRLYLQKPHFQIRPHSKLGEHGLCGSTVEPSTDGTAWCQEGGLGSQAAWDSNPRSATHSLCDLETLLTSLNLSVPSCLKKRMIDRLGEAAKMTHAQTLAPCVAHSKCSNMSALPCVLVMRDKGTEVRLPGRNPRSLTFHCGKMDKLLNSLSLKYLMYWVDRKVRSSFSYAL